MERRIGSVSQLNARSSANLSIVEAWIGGVREPDDIRALLENLRYAWLRAKVQVLGEELAV